MNESPMPAPGQDSWLADLYRKRWIRVVMLVLAIPTVLALVLGAYLWQRFGSDRAVEYTDVEEHFKYGSTGGEHVSGLPYWIFQALPQVCAQHLPGKGYASLGLIYEEGHDLPIGMDNQTSQDGARNGLFTGTLKKVWNAGKFKGGYRKLRDTVVSKMPPDQTPNYYFVGAANADFEAQRPWTI